MKEQFYTLQDLGSKANDPIIMGLLPLSPSETLLLVPTFAFPSTCLTQFHPCL